MVDIRIVQKITVNVSLCPVTHLNKMGGNRFRLHSNGAFFGGGMIILKRLESDGFEAGIMSMCPDADERDLWEAEERARHLLSGIKIEDARRWQGETR